MGAERAVALAPSPPAFPPGLPRPGAIVGEPVPLDTQDARYADYFLEVRRRIEAHWGYPCVRDARTLACAYHAATLEVDFGIGKDGRVPYVRVRRSSGLDLYDAYATNAIRLAAPFPPVPDHLRPGGLPVHVRFHYVLGGGLTKVLR